ncbi:MAG: tripartite tricarboxylate transporter substrate binding protein [Burkholderiales bacterium]
MNTPRRSLIAAALAAATLPVVARAQAPAPAWPSKPIRLVVPYATGGFNDLRSRQIGQHLSKALGQPVIIDNKAGAGGTLGIDLVAKAAPDGYTIGMGNLASLSVNVSLMKKVPYDPQKDLAPIVLVEQSPLVLTAGPGTSAKTVGELLAQARAQPGKLTFASSGIGGAHHLSGEMLLQLAGADLAHVPYKGGSQGATDLMAGHVAVMFEMGYSALPSIKAGRIRALAVTSSKRLQVLPDVPTMIEAGVQGFESYNWQGLVAPAGTPRAIVDRLNREVNAILAMPEVRDGIVAQGSQPSGGTPEQFAAFVKTETAKWGKVVRDANIQPE